MEGFLKDNDLVTISGNIKIFVLKAFEHKNEKYGYWQDVTNSNDSTPKYLMVKEIIVDNTPQLQILTNTNEIEEVLQTLKTLSTK